VETNSFALSRARAESVKKYFVNNWGISPDRIRTKARNLPAMPSKTSEHDYFDAVRDENRRVEISAYDWRIVEPVVTFDTLRSITPENIRFFAETKGDIPVKSSKFNASIGTEQLLALANDESDKIEGEINIVQSRNYFQQTKTRIDYTYEGRNSEGFACTTKGFVPYKVVIKDSTFDRYSLILFDFDSFTLSEANTRISNYINTRIAKSEYGEVLGSAEIIGFTDVIGSESYNMELSQKRAESIYNDLNIQSEKISYKGIGEEKPLYPDIFPEGRFYSRTVTITVINPRDLKNGR
jgi:outer membrane protein OmpA-like peptidoglycan-associated protein